MVILIVMVSRQTHAQVSGEQVYYYHLDHLGTPIEMTDANQNIVWQASYDPFGQITINTATISNNLRFPGMYADSETGLYYNMNRYYYPSIGRYIEPDPALQLIRLSDLGGINIISLNLNKWVNLLNEWSNRPQMLNLFVYVANNPLNQFDLLGLQSEGNNTSVSCPCKPYFHTDRFWPCITARMTSPNYWHVVVGAGAAAAGGAAIGAAIGGPPGATVGGIIGGTIGVGGVLGYLSPCYQYAVCCGKGGCSKPIPMD